jgi:hypothetical protein
MKDKNSIKNLLIFSLIMVIVGFGCKKTEIQHFSSSIIGEWTWVSTCGGFTGFCATPKSINDKVNLVFTADSILNYYQADTLRATSRFHIYRIIYADNPNDTMNILQNDGRNQYFTLSGNILYLTYEGADFGSDYKRVR